MIRQKFEAGLLRVAAFILDRNVERSGVTSRRDNNRLFAIEFEIRDIAGRISEGYKAVPTTKGEK